MEEYFIELLKRNSKVPAPETILEVLDNNNLFDNSNIPRIDSSEGPRPVPIAKFERSIMLEIQKISKWLANDAKYDSYSKHYGQIRGNILHQTLMQLKELGCQKPYLFSIGGTTKVYHKVYHLGLG